MRLTIIIVWILETIPSAAKCSTVSLVFGNVRFVLLFARVPWKGASNENLLFEMGFFSISIWMSLIIDISRIVTIISWLHDSDLAYCDKCYHLSVRLLHSLFVHPAKTVERNEMPFGRDTRVVPSNIVLDRGPVAPLEWEIWEIGLGIKLQVRTYCQKRNLITKYKFFGLFTPSCGNFWYWYFTSWDI